MLKRQYPSGFEVFIEGYKLPINDVISAELQDGLELLDELTVKIRNSNLSYTKGVKNVFRGKKIRLEGGYYGKVWRAMFSGTIGAAWPSGDEAGDIITLKALPVDISHLWHVKRSYSLYEGFARHSAVVQEIIDRFHPDFRSEIEPSPSCEGIMVPIQHNETDIQFCKRMAKEAGGFEFLIKGDTVFFRRPDTSGEPQITYKLGVNIKSYSFQEDDSILKAAVEYYTGGVAGNSTKPESGSVQTADTQMEDEGRSSGTRKRKTDASENKSYILLAGMDPQLAELAAKGKTKEPASLEQTLTITAPGDPRATAGTNAKVEDLGWIDGVWYQRNISHTFDESGYGMSVECSNHV